MILTIVVRTTWNEVTYKKKYAVEKDDMPDIWYQLMEVMLNSKAKELDKPIGNSD